MCLVMATLLAVCPRRNVSSFFPPLRRCLLTSPAPLLRVGVVVVDRFAVFPSTGFTGGTSVLSCFRAVFWFRKDFEQAGYLTESKGRSHSVLGLLISSGWKLFLRVCMGCLTTPWFRKHVLLNSRSFCVRVFYRGSVPRRKHSIQELFQFCIAHSSLPAISLGVFSSS